MNLNQFKLFKETLESTNIKISVIADLFIDRKTKFLNAFYRANAYFFEKDDVDLIIKFLKEREREIYFVCICNSKYELKEYGRLLSFIGVKKSDFAISCGMTPYNLTTRMHGYSKLKSEEEESMVKEFLMISRMLNFLAFYLSYNPLLEELAAIKGAPFPESGGLETFDLDNPKIQ